MCMWMLKKFVVYFIQIQTYMPVWVYICMQCMCICCSKYFILVARSCGWLLLRVRCVRRHSGPSARSLVSVNWPTAHTNTNTRTKVTAPRTWKGTSMRLRHAQQPCADDDGDDDDDVDDQVKFSLPCVCDLHSALGAKFFDWHLPS